MTRTKNKSSNNPPGESPHRLAQFRLLHEVCFCHDSLEFSDGSHPLVETIFLRSGLDKIHSHAFEVPEYESSNNVAQFELRNKSYRLSILLEELFRLQQNGWIESKFIVSNDQNVTFSLHYDHLSRTENLEKQLAQILLRENTSERCFEFNFNQMTCLLEAGVVFGTEEKIYLKKVIFFSNAKGFDTALTMQKHDDDARRARQQERFNASMLLNARSSRKIAGRALCAASVLAVCSVLNLILNSTGWEPLKERDSTLKAVSTSASSEFKLNTVPAASYDRDNWQHWSDFDGDCMNTRHEILKDQADGPIKLSPDGCYVSTGLWIDPFSGKEFHRASELDVDHVVPLKWAYDHGGAKWSLRKKEAFANDPINLLAVHDRLNQQKGASGPSEWMPPNQAFHCEYLAIWKQVLAKYPSLIMEASSSKNFTAKLQNCP